MKFKLFIAVTISLLVLISACGGGSSSGGDVKPVFEDDGIYEGTQNIRFLDPDRVLLDEQEFVFSMSVFEGNVTISDPSFSAQAPISDGVFIASSGELVESDIEANITCRTTLIYNGSLAAGSTQGTIQGNSICSQISGANSGRNTSFPLDGTFEAVRGILSSKISLINDIELDLTRIGKAIANTP